jgi:hypothetical protein
MMEENPGKTKFRISHPFFANTRNALTKKLPAKTPLEALNFSHPKFTAVVSAESAESAAVF